MSQRNRSGYDQRTARAGATRQAWKGVSVFLAIAFGLSWLAQFLLAETFEETATQGAFNPGYILIAAALMFPPAIGAFVVRRWLEGNNFGDAGLRWPSKNYLALAWLGPPLLVLVTFLISLPLYSLSPEVTEAPAEAGASIGLSLTVGVLLSSLFAFGEEFGWRGYLLPRLVSLMGLWPGLLAHGAIWGFWHAPFILLIGYNYPDSPILGAPMFVVFGTLAGVLFGWLQLASNSVVAPTVAHGSLNAVGGLSIGFLAGVEPTVAGALHSPLGWLVLLVTIGLLYRAGRLEVATGEKEALEPSPSVAHVPKE